MTPPPTRECGPCTACCTVLSVDEIEKPAFEPCAKLCDTGCGIYDERPASCRGFECLWIRGMLDDDPTDTRRRPDSAGIVVDYQRRSAFGEIFKCYEIAPGSSDWMRAAQIIDRLKKRFVVVIIAKEGNRRVLGPPHLVTAAREVIRRKKLGL